jgi:hypothetical protein
MVVLEDFFLVFQIFLYYINFRIFPVIAARRSVAIFACPATSLPFYFWLADVDHVVCLISLVLVLLPMVIDNFNGCVYACILNIAAQIKIM